MGGNTAKPISPQTVFGTNSTGITGRLVLSDPLCKWFHIVRVQNKTY